jgi:hypothetical protein
MVPQEPAVEAPGVVPAPVAEEPVAPYQAPVVEPTPVEQPVA